MRHRGTGVTVAVVGVLLTLLAPIAQATGVDVTVSPSGLVSSQVSFTDPNGSALRYAIDGNFTPFIDALPVNASVRAALLLALELNPYVQLYSGNHDGIVETNEVGLFEELVVAESKLLPAASLSAGFTSTLDGQGPSSTTLDSLALANATGPDSSSAPIDLTAGVSQQFPYTGSRHVLSFALNATAGLTAPTLPGAVQVRVTTPENTAITSTDGLQNVSTANDPLGWGSATTTGSFAPDRSTSATVHFDAAFPLGTVLLIALPVGAAAGGIGLLLYRRRRRRPTEVAEPVVPAHVDRD